MFHIECERLNAERPYHYEHELYLDGIELY